MQDETWYRLRAKVDPWGYENLLAVQKAIGAKTRSQALRYILGRSLSLVDRRRRVSR